MAQNVNPELLAKFRERLALNGTKVDIEFPGAPIGIVHGNSIPFTGNMHIPGGRAAKRTAVDKIFSKLKF